MDELSQRLYDLGRADLEVRYDTQLGLIRDPFRPDRHSPHHSLWYAQYLLDDGDLAGAERIVEAVLSKQELREGDPHFGNFSWHWEDDVVIDLNACQFVLEALTTISLDTLSAELRSRVHQAMRLALTEAERLDVHWTYTNIHLLDVRNRILGGQMLGDETIVAKGSARLADWAERTRRIGAPHEFNSPTYAAVQINALAAIAEQAVDPDVRATALEMEQFLWRHVAKYWHAPTMQLAGPHSRAYRRDVVGASGYLKVVLYKLLGDERLLAKTPYYEGPDAEGELVVALTTYHCPPDAEEMLRNPDMRTVREVSLRADDLGGVGADHAGVHVRHINPSIWCRRAAGALAGARRLHRVLATRRRPGLRGAVHAVSSQRWESWQAVAGGRTGMAGHLGRRCVSRGAGWSAGNRRVRVDATRTTAG